MAEINLIPADDRLTVKTELLQRKLQFAAIGLLVIAGVLTVLTLFLYTTASAQRSSLETEVSEATSKINRLKAQEELIVVVKDKVSAANTLIKLRVNYSDFFAKLSALIPQGIYFTDIRFTGEKMVISGKAKSSAEVARLSNSLTSSAGSELVSDVAVDSLSSDQSGQYVFVMSAKLAVGRSVADLQPGSEQNFEEPL